MATKPSIVFVHGLWADGSCFSKLIPTLQAEDFEVIASQHYSTVHRDSSLLDCFVEGRRRGPLVHSGYREPAPSAMCSQRTDS